MICIAATSCCLPFLCWRLAVCLELEGLAGRYSSNDHRELKLTWTSESVIGASQDNRSIYRLLMESNRSRIGVRADAVGIRPCRAMELDWKAWKAMRTRRKRAEGAPKPKSRDLPAARVVVRALLFCASSPPSKCLSEVHLRALLQLNLVMNL